MTLLLVILLGGLALFLLAARALLWFGRHPNCVCGCPRDAHDHFRVGSDCTCGCPRFRRIDWAAFMRPTDYQKRTMR